MAGRTIVVVAPNKCAFKQLGIQLVALSETSCRCQKLTGGQKSSLKDHMCIKMHRCINRDPVKTEEGARTRFFFFSFGGSCKIAELFFLFICLDCSKF